MHRLRVLNLECCLVQGRHLLSLQLRGLLPTLQCLAAGCYIMPHSLRKIVQAYLSLISAACFACNSINTTVQLSIPPSAPHSSTG